MQSVSITTSYVAGLNPSHGEVYLIPHYVIKFVSDLRQVGGFLRVFRFHPPIKLTATINTINLTPNPLKLALFVFCNVTYFQL